MLRIDSLSYVLKKNALISNISLEFSSGHFYGILGPNGSGKSSLLKSMAAIWKPTSGKVYWNGEDLHQKERLEISKIMTLVPQNPQCSFDFSVNEVVIMGRYAYGRKSSQENINLLEKYLKKLDLWHLRNKNVSRISIGERQRVFIARALISENPIILLDEPTASLDIQHQREIWLILKELSRNGKIIITATHDLSATKQFCDQVIVLNEGTCISNGSFSSVVNTLENAFGLSTLSCPML